MASLSVWMDMGVNIKGRWLCKALSEAGYGWPRGGLIFEGKVRVNVSGLSICSNLLEVPCI